MLTPLDASIDGKNPLPEGRFQGTETRNWQPGFRLPRQRAASESRYDVRLRKMELTRMIPAIRIRIDFTENVNLGPGKIALLEAIRSTGSISDAARSLGMSYRRAWLLVNSLKEGFSEAVTVSATGGKGGGGARVTPFGLTLIKQFRLLEREIARLSAQRLTMFVPLVNAKAPRPNGAARKQLARKIAPAAGR
jgi:molybdate transport system regulatory protein